MIPKTIIHLLSGGLDSVTMLYDLKEQGHNVHCLLVDYKQQHVQELTFAVMHCRRLGVQFTKEETSALGGLTDDDKWIVPVRNLVLTSLAANLAVRAKADTVTIGCNKDDEANFPDCRMAFYQLLNTLLTTGETQVEICTPYIDWPKWKIAAQSKRLGVAVHEIWTCYQPTERGACGKCPACRKLGVAFAMEAEMREMRPL